MERRHHDLLIIRLTKVVTHGHAHIAERELDVWFPNINRQRVWAEIHATWREYVFQEANDVPAIVGKFGGEYVIVFAQGVTLSSDTMENPWTLLADMKRREEVKT